MKTLLTLLTLFLGYSFSAHAMLVSQADINTELATATLVGDIEILDKTAENAPVVFIKSKSAVKLLSITKFQDDGGWIPEVGDTFDLEYPGGELDDVGVFLTGYPRPRVGGKYKAYLKRVEGHLFAIVGLEQGLLPLQKTRSFSRNRTDGSNGLGFGPFLYWDRDAFPIPYFISYPTFKDRPQFVPAIDASFATWGAPAFSTVNFMGMGCTSATMNENDGINTIIYVTDRWIFDTAAIAITRNFYVAGSSPRAGMILDSDILINGVNHNFSVTSEAGKHDVQNIITHEVGHFIGFGHEVTPIDPDATMLAVASPGEQGKRILHNSELNGLMSAYGGVSTNKIITPIPSCMITDNKGCLAVHDAKPPSAGTIAWIVLYLAATIWCGRRLTSVFASLVSLWPLKRSSDTGR